MPESGAEVQADLLRQVAELRATVEALRGALAARQRITLRALQDRPYLGQPVNLVAAVATGAGEPVADAPVTLTTTWGRLRAVSGAAVREAASVAVRTTADGAARVLLVAPTPGNLTPSQQSTLEDALRALDPAARTPDDAAAGLRTLAEQYRWDGHPELRQAIDVYFHQMGPPHPTGVLRLAGDPWRFVDAAVLAFARDGSTTDADLADTAVLAMAALPLRFTDWLAPWLQALLDLAETESTLGRELAAGRPQGAAADAGALLGHVYGRVRDFVADQKGAVGELVGRRIAEGSLRELLATGLADLPAATQAAVLPGIEVASGTIATAGAGVLAAVGQAHSDLSRSIDTKIATVPKVDLTPLTGRLDRLETTVATKTDLTPLAGRIDHLETTVATKADLTGITGRLDHLDTAVGSKAEAAALDNLNANLLKEVGTLRDRSANLEGRVATLDTSVTRIDNNVRLNRRGGAIDPGR